VFIRGLTDLTDLTGLNGLTGVTFFGETFSILGSYLVGDEFDLEHSEQTNSFAPSMTTEWARPKIWLPQTSQSISEFPRLRFL